MSADATLNSRLRKLVAKTFRAEQLYASMRNSYQVKSDMLAAAANDSRAREWQQAHAALRTALNDLVAANPRGAIISRLIGLKQQFEFQAAEANEAVTSGAIRISETARRHEFAHVMKLAFELLQHKARAQVAQVIVDELSALLQPGERAMSAKAVADTAAALAAEPSENIAARSGVDSAQLDSTGTLSEDSYSVGDNVIPLRRRFARSGSGSR